MRATEGWKAARVERERSVRVWCGHSITKGGAEESDELSTSACTPLCIHQGIRHRLAGGKRAFGRHDVLLTMEDTARICDEDMVPFAT